VHLDIITEQISVFLFSYAPILPVTFTVLAMILEVIQYALAILAMPQVEMIFA